MPNWASSVCRYQWATEYDFDQLGQVYDKRSNHYAGGAVAAGGSGGSNFLSVIASHLVASTQSPPIHNAQLLTRRWVGRGAKSTRKAGWSNEHNSLAPGGGNPKYPGAINRAAPMRGRIE